MQKTIKQTFEQFLVEKKGELALRTYKYHEEAVAWLEDCINGYGGNSLDKEGQRKFDEGQLVGLEFCDIFESQILDNSHFSEFLGYFYPKKIACGHDMAQKTCGAIIKLYKWMLDKRYIFAEDDDVEFEYKEGVDNLRQAFKGGMDEYCNY